MAHYAGNVRHSGWRLVAGHRAERFGGGDRGNRQHEDVEQEVYRKPWRGALQKSNRKRRLARVSTLSLTGLWRELIDRAVVSVTSMDGSSVEIPRGIADHSVVSEARLRSAGKAIRHALGPLAIATGSHFEDDAASARRRAAVTRGSIQIARRIRYQAADGTRSVRSPFEAVQHAFGPRSIAVR